MKIIKNPYTTTYIGADAQTWGVNSDGTLKEFHSKKAIPITFGF